MLIGSLLFYQARLVERKRELIEKALLIEEAAQNMKWEQSSEKYIFKM